jgi:hypothetical protein
LAFQASNANNQQELATLQLQLIISLFAAACCGCNPAAAAASTVFFSLWIAAAAVQTAATVSACSQPNSYDPPNSYDREPSLQNVLPYMSMQTLHPFLLAI